MQNHSRLRNLRFICYKIIVPTIFSYLWAYAILNLPLLQKHFVQQHSLISLVYLVFLSLSVSFCYILASFFFFFFFFFFVHSFFFFFFFFFFLFYFILFIYLLFLFCWFGSNTLKVLWEISWSGQSLQCGSLQNCFWCFCQWQAISRLPKSWTYASTYISFVQAYGLAWWAKLTVRGRLITPFILGSMSLDLNILIRYSFADFWVWIMAWVLDPWCNYMYLLISLSVFGFWSYQLLSLLFL